jgi:hypothetical protein
LTSQEKSTLPSADLLQDVRDGMCWKIRLWFAVMSQNWDDIEQVQVTSLVAPLSRGRCRSRTSSTSTGHLDGDGLPRRTSKGFWVSAMHWAGTGKRETPSVKPFR